MRRASIIRSRVGHQRSWPGLNGLSVAISASRVTGIAPLFVYFDAFGSASNQTDRMIDEVDFLWDFGDPSAGTWTYGARAGVANRNTHVGCMAAHVFETAGTYTITCSGFDGVNADIKTITVTVTAAASASEFAGARTVYFSNDSDFTGAPGGSTQVQTLDWSNVLTYAQDDGTQICLKADDTFTGSASFHSIAKRGPGLITRFGTGANPIVKLSAAAANGSTLIRWGAGNMPNMADWRVVDVDFVQEASPTFANTAISLNGGINHLLMLRCKFDNFLLGLNFASGVLDNNNASGNPAFHGHIPPQYFGLIDCVNENWYTPGAAYGAFLFFEKSMIGGNKIDGLGLSDGSHCLRITYAGKSIIAHNHLLRARFNRHNLKLHAPKQGVNNVESNGIGQGYTRWIQVCHNYGLANDASNWIFAMEPQDSVSDERLKDIVVERNYGKAGLATSAMFNCSGDGFTIRYNIADLTGATGAAGDHVMISVNQRGIEPQSTNAAVYNNTAYSSDTAADFTGVVIGSGVTTRVVSNNLGYCPNDTLHQMVSGTFTGSNNSATPQSTNPLFVGPLTSGAGFALSSGSPADGTGTSTGIKSWRDFTLKDLRGLVRDMGAVDR